MITYFQCGVFVVVIVRNGLVYRPSHNIYAFRVNPKQNPWNCFSQIVFYHKTPTQNVFLRKLWAHRMKIIEIFSKHIGK